MKRALIFGDSYVAAADRGRPGYARVAPLLLGWRGHHDGLGGTGFVKEGPGGRPAYHARLAQALVERPDVLVVQASGNDAICDLGEVRRAASGFLRAAADEVPALYVVGPMWAKDGHEHLPALRDVVAEVSQGHGRFLDALGWLTPDLVGPDGAHPTWRGHWRIARHLARAIRAAQ